MIGHTRRRKKREFSLRSRAEVSFFRTEFFGKYSSYKAYAGVAQAGDIICQMLDCQGFAR